MSRLKNIAENSFTNFLSISRKHFKYRIKYVKAVLYEELKNCRRINTMRQNIFNRNGKLIGQNYQRDNGDWMHKWKSINHEGFDKFSWNGKAKGNDMETWTYENALKG